MATKNPNKSSKRRVAARGLLLGLLLASSFLFVATRYKVANFGDAQIDEIIFYLANGLVESNTASFAEAFKDNLVLWLFIAFLLTLPVIDFYRNKINISFNLSLLGRKKRLTINPSKIPFKHKLGYGVIVFVVSVAVLFNSFGVLSYVRSLSQTTQIYEDNYVDPRTARLTFPEKKKNLIYIYLESMENTVGSAENGGQSTTSLIPELEQLALDSQNTSFSNLPSGLGGALPVQGTTWTVGGITAQMGGVPLRGNVLGQDHNSMGMLKQFMPGAYTIGDILSSQGYNQTFVMGSVASFGGRDKLLVQHGNFMIQDYNYAKQSGQIPADYGVWWGYEDKKLFEFAKSEIERLSQLSSPFNVQLLTVDTHFTDGYLDSTCPTPHEKRYDNVYACSSKQVNDFVRWIQEQPFADDTTIVISGDHLGMQTSYYEEKASSLDYVRTIYNAFINSSVTAERQNERLFSVLDMYPSTLAAMGVQIEGDRLGLGTNLFSGQPTLVEQYGNIDSLNEELSKQSKYYNERIFARKQP